MKNLFFVSFCLLSCLLVSCVAKPKLEVVKTNSEAVPKVEAKSAPTLVPKQTPTLASKKEKAKMVEIKTNLGRIVIELNETKAPESTKNFLKYVNDKHYDGTIFHRVIKKFMVQGGNMDKGMKGKSTGKPIKNEAKNGLSNLRGTLAMARTNDPHSATDQFFINVADNKFLDYDSGKPGGDGYAVFGKVTEGLDIVDKIVAVKTGRSGQYDDVPVEPVVIESAQALK